MVPPGLVLFALNKFELSMFKLCYKIEFVDYKICTCACSSVDTTKLGPKKKD